MKISHLKINFRSNLVIGGYKIYIACAKVYSMPYFRIISCVAVVLPVLLSSCDDSPPSYRGPVSYGGNASSVWNNYDVRHPVPRNVVVPSRVQRYDGYQDNDAAYTPPRSYICSNNLENDFCE